MFPSSRPQSRTNVIDVMIFYVIKIIVDNDNSKPKSPAW